MDYLQFVYNHYHSGLLYKAERTENLPTIDWEVVSLIFRLYQGKQLYLLDLFVYAPHKGTFLKWL